MMTDSGDVRPDPINQPSGGRPQNQPEAETPQAEDLFEFAEPDPEPAAGGGADETAPMWYAASGGGRREGPLSLAEMKRRIAAGSLTGENLVWRQGMANWVPAQSVPELFAARAGGPPMPPPLAAKRTAGLADYMGMLDSLFSNPTFFRLAGRVCAALAAMVSMVSVFLLPFAWGREHTWFTGALVFALIFFLGEAAGAVLAALGRLESRSSAESEPADHPE